MGGCARLGARRWAAFAGAAFFCVAAIFSLPFKASAQNTAIISRGDAAVTAFSGARQLGEVPSGLHPLDVTFIDVNGAVLQVFDLTQLGGGASGQVANAPIKFQTTAGEIGQAFGVTLDGDTANATPNIYVTATSLFGLQIVSSGGERLVKGEPGARWMPGQFGLDKGGTPGSVWKIDGVTGVVSLFANIAHDGKDNAGPGLGDIAYDSTTQQFFVSDLETGLIHRLGLDGADRGTFDHGTMGRPKAGLDAVTYDPARRMNIESPSFNIEDPKSWGFADKRRGVFAVAVQDGRLYYSGVEGPQIWSIGLNADGSFGDDARLEFDVTGTPNGNVITDIAFDGAGVLYLAQRGEIVGSYDYSVFAKQEASSVLRYVWNETERRWSAQAEEYAIGLKPPHRSTQGGIALSYGYDADGNIDYNQCRATLWTTGEHLREGEETDRVYQGGARIIHGLQGNDKSAVRPANVPPFSAWYVDNDGLFVDSAVYGYVGDIAIFNPCDKRTIAESVPLPYPLPVPYYPPLPEPVPPVGPGIFIDKVCGPDLFGGEIHCIITVTNIGVTPSDAIDLWDAATIISGPGAGGGVIIAGVSPDGPDWICSPTPTPDLWCSLPPGGLDPGETRSIDVWIDTGPLSAAGNFGFRNCAELEAPWFDFACDDGGTDITVEKTAPAACDPGAECTFTMTVTNTGTKGFSGDVQLTDAMFLPDGTALGAPITAMVPDLGCVPPPAALDFSCVAPLTLAPGESAVFAITVTMPAAPPAYWANNCFAITAPGLPAPALPLAPGVESSTTSCAWVPVGAPPPLSNLRVEKTALNGGACDKLPGDIIGCDYEVAIFNDGPSDFLGPLSFTDEIPATASLSAFPGAWLCLGGPPVACDSAAAVAIPANGSLTMPVTVTTPLAPLEGAGCVMPNTFTLTAPVGTDENYFAGDDASTAEADAFLFWLLPDGTTIVTCDPTNLKTTKVAKGDCDVLGTGYRCLYLVTFTNMGPDPYKGPIKVSEQLGFAPGAVKFSAGWGCTGGGASYQCILPNVDLAKGASVELEVTVDVPGGKHCSLKNTAVMTFPIAPTRFNGDASDDSASATAKIPAKDCEKPERPQCEPGPNEFRSESGACVCKSGFVRDEKGQCAGTVEAPTCPDGKPVPKSGHCPAPTPQCEPGPNETRDAQNQCVCKSGFERDKNGRCVPSRVECELGPNEVRNAQGQCVCREGYVRDPNGRCVPSRVECELGPNEVRNAQGQCVCREGYVRDPNGRCVLPPRPPCEPGPNEVRNAQGQCVCREGYVRDPNGRCVLPPRPPCEPGPNEVRNAQGQCVCREGYVREPNGRCVLPPRPPCDPGPNEVRNAQGKCVCKESYVRDPNGRCVPPGSQCRQGWIWNGKQCVNPADACKLRGWVWDDNTCLNPADICKSKGWTWDGKRCLSPADACKLKGWNWDGKQCLPPLSRPEECRKKGWIWDGQRCLSPADACKQKGGVWDGSKCQPKTDPADACKKRGGVWDGRTCQSPAELCKQRGGVWEGGKCQPKTNPADECKKKGGTWDGQRCVPKTGRPTLSAPDTSPAEQCRKAGKLWDGKQCLGRAEQCRATGGVWDKATKTCKPATLGPR